MSPVTLKKGEGRNKYLIHVPCNKCVECMSRNTQQWAFRLQNELKHSKCAVVVTLTYDDENVPKATDFNTGEIQLTLSKQDATKFIKSIRKRTKRQGIKYFLVGEYGKETNRPHYHAIIFNVSPADQDKIKDAWHRGFTYIDSPSSASIGYILKYINKSVFAYAKKQIRKEVPEFRLISKKIGNNYIYTNGKHHKRIMENYATRENGRKVHLPKYYSNRIFNYREKEELTKEYIKQNDYTDNLEIQELGLTQWIKNKNDQKEDRVRRYHKLMSKKDKI